MKKIIISFIIGISLLSTTIAQRDIPFYNVVNFFKGFKMNGSVVVDTIYDWSTGMPITRHLTAGVDPDSVTIDNNAIHFYGNATVWEDLQVPITSGRQGINAKPDFDSVNIAYLFPQNDKTEVIYIIAQMPHAWKEGSTIYPHVHWNQAANTAVKFRILYKWTNMGAAPSATWTNADIATNVYTYTSGTLHQVSSTVSGISGSGKTISSILVIKLFRDDNTTTGDVSVKQFDIHYERDALGSSTISSK